MRSESLDELREAYFTALKADQHFAAAEAGRRLMEIDPVSTIWRRMYALALSSTDRFVDAERLLLALAAEEPANDGTTLSLGRLYRDWGNLPEAERWFRRTCELSPDKTWPWIFLGTALTRQLRLPEAEVAMRQALLAEGDRDEAYLNLGNVRMLLGDQADARHCYEQAIAICPDYEAAKLRLSDLNEVERIQAME